MPDLHEAIRSRLKAAGAPSSDFDLNPEIILPAGRSTRPASVLIAVTDWGDDPHVLLTKRSSALKHHPGQIAFPGGKQDDTDASIEAAALREAEEEIGLPRDAVSVLGTMPCHETVTGFTVTPVVGIVSEPFEIRPEPGEVDEVFSVPLRFLLNVDHFSQQSRRWRGQRRYYFTVPFGPYYIWGATARMLRAFADRMEGL